MKGGGKYGRICETLAVNLEAQVVALLVVGGKRGSGFSITQEWEWDITGHKEALAKLPAVLRSMAEDIEKDLGK